MKKILSLAGFLLVGFSPFAQVGIGTTNPDASAKLEIVSTSQGVLFPRMTSAQRATIQNPATGLMVFQVDGSKGLYYFDGSAWRNQLTGLVPNANGIAGPGTGIGSFTTYAGNGNNVAADGNLSTASFSSPFAVCSSGTDLYVTENSQNLRRINALGQVTTSLFPVSGVLNIAVHGSNIYWNSGSQVFKTTPTGDVSFAGGVAPGDADGNGSAARFRFIVTMATDAAGNLYVSELLNFGVGRLRKITPTADVTTLSFFDPFGNPVSFGVIPGMAIDANGNIYITESIGGVGKVYRLTGNQAVLVAGGSSPVPCIAPSSIAVAGNGNLYVNEFVKGIRCIRPNGENYMVLDPAMNDPSQYRLRGMAVLNNALYVADDVKNVIRKVVVE